MTPSYQAEGPIPPQGSIEAQNTGVTANHHGVKVQHAEALQAAGPGKGHVGLAAGKHTAQRHLHTIQGHALGRERQGWSHLSLCFPCAQEADPTSSSPAMAPDLLALFIESEPERQDDGCLSKGVSRKYGSKIRAEG